MPDKSTQPRLDVTKVSPDLFKAMASLEKRNGVQRWSCTAAILNHSPLWVADSTGATPCTLIWHVGMACIWRDMHGHGSRRS